MLRPIRSLIYKYRKGLVLGVIAGGSLCFLNANQSDSYFEVSKNLDIYATLFKELNTYYVDPIEPGKLVKTGIDAMLNELDPYTNFYSEADIEDYRFQTTGKYGGIGAAIRTVGDETVIAEPYEGSPIMKAGIRAGDQLMEIDGKVVKTLTQDDISKLLRGAAGTTVNLKLKSAQTQQIYDKAVIREDINIGSVPYAGMLNDNTGYIRLTQFTERCGSLVSKAYDSLRKANPAMQGIVLDLRGNPGGLLDEAVNVCNIFMDRGQLVVSTKGKVKEWDKDFKTQNTPIDTKMSLAVIINRGSASASEIVAGTVQDLDRGVVIGEKSFGKGLVQTTRPLSYNTRLKITTAKYYTPSGRCIQAIDYSHRNEDGSVGNIPDSLKHQFKTTNGRKVSDGGGIEPDVKIETSDLSKLSVALLNKNFIFNYATQYYYQHPTITKASDFVITDADFDSFVKWVDGKDYAYKTKTEEALDELKETATKEKYYASVQKEYEVLKTKLSHDKKQDLYKNKDEVKRLLQSEIVTRYYYQKGRIENGLRDDKEVKEAITILAAPQKVNTILAKKQ